MALQFNIGMAYRNLISNKSMLSTSVGGPKNPDNYIGSRSEFSDTTAWGFHLGSRFNLHMLFIGVDYAFFPQYRLRVDVNQWENVETSNKKLSLAGHQVGFTVGITINRVLADGFNR